MRSRAKAAETERLEAEARLEEAKARAEEAQVRRLDAENQKDFLALQIRNQEREAEWQRVHAKALEENAGKPSFMTRVRRHPRWIPLFILAALILLWSHFTTAETWLIITTIILVGVIIFVTIGVLNWGIREVFLEFLLAPLWWFEVGFFQPHVYGSSEQSNIRTLCESVTYIPLMVLISLVVGGKIYERFLRGDKKRRDPALITTAWGPTIVSQAIYMLWLLIFGKLLFGDQYLDAKYIWFALVILAILFWTGPEAWRTGKYETHISREEAALRPQPTDGPPPDQTDPESED